MKGRRLVTVLCLVAGMAIGGEVRGFASARHGSRNNAQSVGERVPADATAILVESAAQFLKHCVRSLGPVPCGSAATEFSGTGSKARPGDVVALIHGALRVEQPVHLRI